MSCISKILEVKGDKEFIVDGNIAIEGGGNYRDYEYIITFVERGHRCGYVAIQEKHKLYHSNEYHPDFDVHGGITYFDDSRFENLIGGHKCTDKWIGFDAAHGDDSEDINKSEKYFGKTEYIKYMKENSECNIDISSHKTYEYMKNECEKLIDQLIKYEQ